MILRIKPLIESVYKNWLYLRYQNLAVPKEVMFLLQCLRKKFRIALITNGTSAAQWEKIDRLNLRDSFDLILVSGDLSYEKPNKDIFFRACNYLDVKPKHCIIVGDKLETDIQGGIEAGLAGTIWIPLSGHFSLTETDPQPDYILKNVMELKQLLSNPQEFAARLAYLKSPQGKRDIRVKMSRSNLSYLGCEDQSSSCSSDSSISNMEPRKYLQFHRMFLPEEDSNSNASDGS